MSLTKYTKIIVDLPEDGRVESRLNDEPLLTLRYGTFEEGYSIEDLRSLANGILEFCDEVEKGGK
ncbi:MAG: hypothetical protein C5B59_12755 [Bacteroidetes bacterium]|nr:MAG: hypothetical protein C5B59_12755 [Bacteroidota bacterium]